MIAALELASRAAAALRGPPHRCRPSRSSTSEPEFHFERRWTAPSVAVPQTEAHGLIEQLMILTNERVAELSSAAASRRSTASTSNPTRLGSSRHGRAARRARIADPAAAGTDLSRARRRARRRGEPPGGPRGRAPRTRPRRVYIARAPFAEAGPLHGPKPRPRRSRQPRLLPLHLADPQLPGPDRPPGPAVRARGRGARRPSRAASPRRAGSAPSASATRSESSATPTRSAPRSCSSGSCSRRAPTPVSRARSREWSALAPSSPSAASSPTSTRAFSRRAGSAAERYELDHTETVIVGARGGRRLASATRSPSASTASRRARGRVDLVPAGEIGA